MNDINFGIYTYLSSNVIDNLIIHRSSNNSFNNIWTGINLNIRANVNTIKTNINNTIKTNINNTITL